MPIVACVDALLPSWNVAPVLPLMVRVTVLPAAIVPIWNDTPTPAPLYETELPSTAAAWPLTVTFASTPVSLSVLTPLPVMSCVRTNPAAPLSWLQTFRLPAAQVEERPVWAAAWLIFHEMEERASPTLTLITRRAQLCPESRMSSRRRVPRS